MWGREREIVMLSNKVQAELATRPENHPESEIFPGDVRDSPLLFWVGIIAGGMLLLGLLWLWVR